MPFSFAASRSIVGDDDVPRIALKISGDECEMNVWLRIDELDRLREVPTARWEGGALKLGTSANADVWWSCDDGFVFVASGHDDETWDFGLHFPMVAFTDLEAAIDHELVERPL